MRKILSIADERLPNPEKFQRHKMGPVIYYSRERLLRIAKRCQAKGWKIPRDMSGLGTWFG
jgi:hypothetical protein